MKYIEIGDFTQSVPDQLLNREDDLGTFIKAVFSMQNVIRDMVREFETQSTGSVSNPVFIDSIFEKTQEAASQAAAAIEKLADEKDAVDDNLRASLEKLDFLNSRLQLLVDEEVQKNRQRDAVIIYRSRQAKMGQMIGNIAHQWRQPLNSLSIILSELEDCYRYGKFDEIYLQNAVNKSSRIISRMSQTIDDFRNFLTPALEKRIFFHI